MRLPNGNDQRSITRQGCVQGTMATDDLGDDRGAPPIPEVVWLRPVGPSHFAAPLGATPLPRGGTGLAERM